MVDAYFKFVGAKFEFIRESVLDLFFVMLFLRWRHTCLYLYFGGWIEN